MWSTRVIGGIRLLPNPAIPRIPVSVKCSLAVAIEDYIITAQDEGRRLVLISNVERILQPVIDVCAPLEGMRRVPKTASWDETYQKCSQKVNLHIVKPSDVQDGVHIVCPRVENDTAMVSATCERV